MGCLLVALGYSYCLLSMFLCRYDRTSGTRYGHASNILINLLMCVATFFNALYGMTAVSRVVRPVCAAELIRD